MERRLSAILSADVAGYSRLMAADEEATLRTLTAYREQVSALVGENRGYVVDAPGDNLLAEFPSALDAARCALQIQRVVAARNAPLPEDRRMKFRIGVHVGDVMAEEGRIYGDGVNIAARLESLAEAGGVCISATVHEQVREKLGVGFVDLGEKAVKNIPNPVRVYRIEAGQSVGPKARRPRQLRKAAGLAAGVLFIIAAGLWVSWPRPMGLLLDWMGASGPPVNPPLPEKPSIVVLPFENMSGDAEQEYFADGISEDLTTELARNDALFVISRNSAFSYKGQPIKVEAVARELGVRYVLEGSVRRAEDQVRITAQLIDASNGFHIWSERYDRELSDIFALQSELSTEIQTALQVEIRDAELARVRRLGTSNLDAYDAMLRGMSHFERLRHQEVLEARRHFARAFELDPDYAAARAMYGNSHAVEYTMGWNRDPSLLAVAEESARSALELGDASADSRNVLGAVHLARGEFEAAAEWYERAIEAEPSHDIPHLGLSVALGAQGRILPALTSTRRAMRLNPRGSPLQRTAVGFANYRAGRIEEAIAQLEQARSENPDFVLPRLFLIFHRDSTGERDSARTIAGEILSINPKLTAAEADRMFFAFAASDAFRRAGLP